MDPKLHRIVLSALMSFFLLVSQNVTVFATEGKETANDEEAILEVTKESRETDTEETAEEVTETTYEKSVSETEESIISETEQTESSDLAEEQGMLTEEVLPEISMTEENCFFS